MSDIKAGDLAVIVRWDHQHGDEYIGYVVQVESIDPRGCECPICRIEVVAGPSAYTHLKGKECGLPLPWLKRIPPMKELEGQRTEENLKEPA